MINVITYIYLNYINIVDTSEIDKAIEEMSALDDRNPLLFNTIKQITDKKNVEPHILEEELKVINKK